MTSQRACAPLLVAVAAIFLQLVYSPLARAESPVVLKQDVEIYQLGPHLSILEDKTGKLTLEDIIRSDREKTFISPERLIPNFGFTGSAYWVRFSVENPLDEKQYLMLEDAYPHHDRVLVYIITPGKIIRTVEGGDGVPYSRRELAYRNIVFRMDVAPRTAAVVYMRFKSESSMQLPLTLWKPVALLEKVNREQTFLGVYFGVMLAMMVYNLFLFAFLRDRNYLFYVLYILSFLFAQLGVNRLDVEYLWPNHPNFANLSHAVFFNLTFFFGCLFCRSFLETKKNAPWIDKIIILLMGTSLAGAALSVLVGYTAGIMCVVMGSAIFAPIFLLAAGIRCWSLGITSARYYTIGWVTFLLGAMAFNLRNMGVLPSVFITDFSPHIGSAIEVLFLSLALADRINVIEKAKLAAEKALANELEKQVEEKTSDIKKLSGLLPICASCKKIRDDHGYWQQVEEYLEEHSDAQFSHGICPDCVEKLYPDLAQKIKEKASASSDSER